MMQSKWVIDEPHRKDKYSKSWINRERREKKGILKKDIVRILHRHKIVRDAVEKNNLITIYGDVDKQQKVKQVR